MFSSWFSAQKASPTSPPTSPPPPQVFDPAVAVDAPETLPPPSPHVQPTPFQRVLDTADLPPPGPDHFEARRKLWTTPPPGAPPPDPDSPSRRRLAAVLDAPGALESEHVWRAGLERVWHGLVGGGQLKYALPLRLVDKILYAGWIRDGTWPVGETPDDEDNFFGTRDTTAAGVPVAQQPLAVAEAEDAEAEDTEAAPRRR